MFMNYSKIINHTAFAALLVTGAFAGFVIGVKLPAAFVSLYSAPATVSVASVISTAVVEPIIPVIKEIKTETKSKIKPVLVPAKPMAKSPLQTTIASKKTAGAKTETLRLINPPAFAEPARPAGGATVGKPDLAVKILETGVIDKVTNVWTATTSLRSIDRIAVRFSVENLGTKETGAWYFNAILPTYPSYIYSANSQNSLLPGDRIEFTLGFDSVEKKDGNVIVINVDPANSIFEASEENNIVRVTLDGVSF
ncbi:MAG: hypothetical protein A3G03_01015 [Candidatus Taylorbacteria bacterium RIFCSPLOWO2_12_FULL_44_15c]|uniref:CARDB domain-containing protein n=1 Tax=Candidatus Taylorbacteria bacterium RIFCSPLOWO2_12_FULL_44_15c TaxID=1802333 RepID=A0A1G2P6H7_9BACT|nr:MAG: hypothetical protein A3G03_01015 [Candidatus Taylorbacteria bacterium RIFCSPLOWO2_12_FULL_44_15c]